MAAASAAAATKTMAKKLVDWHQGIKVIGMVNPDLKKNVQECVTRNSDLQRLLLEAQESRPRLNWETYERILTAPSDNALVHEVLEKVENFHPTALDIDSRIASLESHGQRLVSGPERSCSSN